LNAISYLGPSTASSLPIVVVQPNERFTEQLLCWSGMTDTEHTTSGSNKEECNVELTLLIAIFCIYILCFVSF